MIVPWKIKLNQRDMNLSTGAYLLYARIFHDLKQYAIPKVRKKKSLTGNLVT